jgi:4-amino-4-deoxy-L-arabinose transferase-like glycosyltransferase
MGSGSISSKPNYAVITGIGLCVLLVIRVAAICLSPLNLYADEAQYWRWGETLDWGYYSKPPMIAWVIHAVTAVFGNAEWAIRLPGPFLHTIAAGFLFLTGRSMYGPRVGMFAAFLYALMPAVILSSGIISTDGILMPFWCIALYCLWRLRNGDGGLVSAAGLGAAVGIGFLSKYAMVYFGIGIGLALILDGDTRRALLSKYGLVALAVAATVFAPHIAWNMAHDFKTVSHTVDNANLGGDLLNPGNALTFLADQMGVFGPISFLALLFGLIVMRSEDRGILGRDRLLLCFVLPVLIIILGQAVLSRANANWAATAYPAASILVASWLTRAKPNMTMWLWIGGLSFAAIQLVPDMTLGVRLGIGAALALAIVGYGHLVKHRPVGLLWSSLALHLFVALAFVALALLPAERASALGFDNALKRTKGWDIATTEVMALAEAHQVSAILVDEREVWHSFDYYARNRTLPLISWRRYGVPKSFAESQPLSDTIDDKVLVVSLHAGFRPRMRGDFERFDAIADIDVPLGRRSNGCALSRRFKVYLASEHQPQERSEAWEAQYDGVKEFPNPKCDPASANQ